MAQKDNLVQRCQQGELAAFTELFRQQESRVYRLAFTILQNKQDAEDAVQDVFLRIFEQIKKYRGDSSFQTWLTAVVVNTCRDKLRRQKVRRALSLDWIRGYASQQNMDEELFRRQQRQQLWTLVHQLEEKYRLPAILHYYERIPCDEVAHILGLRTSTVYSRLNNARHKLRAMLQAQSNATHQELAQEL